MSVKCLRNVGRSLKPTRSATSVTGRLVSINRNAACVIRMWRISSTADRSVCYFSLR